MNMKFPWTCCFQEVIRIFTLRVDEKCNNSFDFQILGIVWQPNLKALISVRVLSTNIQIGCTTSHQHVTSLRYTITLTQLIQSQAGA